MQCITICWMKNVLVDLLKHTHSNKILRYKHLFVHFKRASSTIENAFICSLYPARVCTECLLNLWIIVNILHNMATIHVCYIFCLYLTKIIVCKYLLVLLLLRFVEMVEWIEPYFLNTDCVHWTTFPICYTALWALCFMNITQTFQWKKKNSWNWICWF